MDIIGNISGYFEEVETREAYDGYWYEVKDIIVTAILGSLCGLKNMILIAEWEKSAAVLVEVAGTRLCILFIRSTVSYIALIIVGDVQ